VGLKPQNLIDAAKADLKRRESNQQGDHWRPSDIPKYRNYAFHRSHVRRAKGDIVKLLKLAWAQPNIGIESTKRNTRIIYGDGALLAEAIRLLEGTANDTP
jgi:hypothetical protein